MTERQHKNKKRAKDGTIKLKYKHRSKYIQVLNQGNNWPCQLNTRYRTTLSNLN